MEPRPHERETLYKTRQGVLLDMLQWSHVLTNVETSCSVSAPIARGSASMEPRPHERGNVVLSVRTNSTRQRFNGATSSRTWTPAHRHRQHPKPEGHFTVPPS